MSNRIVVDFEAGVEKKQPQQAEQSGMSNTPPIKSEENRAALIGSPAFTQQQSVTPPSPTECPSRERVMGDTVFSVTPVDRLAADTGVGGPSFSVVSASTLSEQDQLFGQDEFGVRNRLRIGEGEIQYIRFVASDLVTVSLHYGLKDGSKYGRTLLCNGADCVICQSKSNTAAKVHLVPVLSLIDMELVVLAVPDKRGPGTLLPQIVPILKETDFSDRAFAITRAKGRYSVRALSEQELVGRDTGDGFLQAMFAANKLPEPADLLCVYEAMSNEDIVATFPDIRRSLDFRGR